MAAYNDNELLQRLLDVGTRREAFADLVRLYSEPLYWKIRRMVLSHEDTDDILQNVFIKAGAALTVFKVDRNYQHGSIVLPLTRRSTTFVGRNVESWPPVPMTT